MTALPLIRWDVPGPYEIGFSTRIGGVSEGAFASLNLGRKLGDDLERVDENRRRLCAEVAADPDRLAMNYQVHGATANRAVAGGRGAHGDALWTDEPGVPMLALTADCVPIALVRANGDRPAAAVAHAGRIGLLAGIVDAAVAALGGRVAAAIGPAIGSCCYEVGSEISDAFRERFGPGVLRGGCLDIVDATERALRGAGVSHVERVDLCTACHTELFFSYRRDGTPRGGQGVVAVVA
jgi:purine-nucleoside/S-methyl-5'-thioadenosine phosphorylase / adenosine deaminase